MTAVTWPDTPRILLVEDSLPIRQRLRSLIEESGKARVVGEASTVVDALSQFKTQAPDAIVLDLQLADGTGYTVLENVKRSQPDCTVIVMTNFAIPEYRERCAALHADHFLEKSADFERVPELLAALAAPDPAVISPPRVASSRSLAGGSRERPDPTPAPLPNPEHHYRHLIESLDVAIYTCDADGRITFYNAAAVALWGREPLLGEDMWCGSWRVLTPEGTLLTVDQYPISIAIRERRPLRGHEIVIERPDGSRRHILPHPQPLFDASGHLTGGVNMLIDVTERRLGEQALKDSRERWKFAIEGSGDGVWDLDVRSLRTQYSTRWKEMLGYDAQEVGDSFEEWATRLHPDDRDRVLAFGKACMDGDVPSIHCEFRMRCKDGSWKWILDRGMVVSRSEDGKPLRLIGTHSDISARKEAEAARTALEVQLRESQKMEAVGTLAGSIAHDFNNVMGAILGNVALARQDLGSEHRAMQSLDQIHRAGLRARSLVRRILSFARRQPQAMQVQLLKPLVEESLDLLRVTLPSGVALHAILDPAPLGA